MNAEKDCTPRCRSSAHARQIQSAVTCGATPSQLRAFAVWLCHNFSTVTDSSGKSLLHMCASHGEVTTLQWLLSKCRGDADVKDFESGWTSLHRACFYGQIAAARVLTLHGANMCTTDHDGLTPLDIVMKDRLPYIEYLSTDPSEVYVWGSNDNYNLGLGNSSGKTTPEILEIFRKDFIDIQQVEMCKFHSVFLSSDGRVFTCGYGHGGRLGQDSEDISLAPSLVKGLNAHFVTQVAAGQDHLLILTETNQVLSCGLNTYHQLGHNPPMERLLAPKLLSLKFLKGQKVTRVCSARFHSVVCTRDALYTFGLNAGQLGHKKEDRTQVNPRQVSALIFEQCHLTHVVASDGATVCATNRGDVYVLHEYQVRKIASRQLEIRKLSAVGGNLDSRCDVVGVREGGGSELRVALLTKTGKVFLWKQTDPYLRRCLFTSPKELIICDMHLSHSTLGLVTDSNEGYLGNLSLAKVKRVAPPPTAPRSNASLRGLVTLIDPDTCHCVRVKKLPNVFRATSIVSDGKGRNFAVLQSNPKMGLVEVPVISETHMTSDFSRLLSEADSYDDFHDIIIKVDNIEFAAHMYILASRSEYFTKQFTKRHFRNGTMFVESVPPNAFRQVLQFIYYNHCDFLTPGHEVKWVVDKENEKKKKPSAKTQSSNPISIVQEASRRLGMVRLAKKLENVKIMNGKISVSESDRVPRITYNRKALTNLCDVNLLSSEGVAFGCHKCVLVARLHYFQSMLGTCWSENSKFAELSLPISSKVMEVMLDFLYSDDSNKVSDSNDIEFLCQVLMISDQLLMQRFKEICEVSLVKLVTLKNAAELLELSAVCNSVQLKRSCMQFICLNLASILESKSLDVLSDVVIEELGSYYRSLVPSMQRRKIKFSSHPTLAELELIEKNHPVDDSTLFQRHKPDSQDVKSKNYRRSNSLRVEITSPVRHEDSSEILNKNSDVNIINPAVESPKVLTVVPVPKVEKESMTPKSPNEARCVKTGQWIMSPPKTHLDTLDKIMQEERTLTAVQKKNTADMKPIPHLSQKQKKMLSVKNQIIESPIASSPPDRSPCPWAKLPQESPPMPSFWDSVSRKDSTSESRQMISPNKSCESQDVHLMTSPITPRPDIVVISLHDIQQAEEQKLRRTLNPTIKPLHILNIEDGAIEELCALYNIHENWRERVTVSRVQAEEIASPIWRRKA